MKKIILIIFILLTGGMAGYLFFIFQNPIFEKLGAYQMYDKIIKERDYAIGQAVMAGDYRCCINPPCTMCYMEENKWNNYVAGTCACDDLIARGEEPCPQCKRGLDDIHGEDNTFCDIDAEVSTCNSVKDDE
jgi:hypothetical protein